MWGVSRHGENSATKDLGEEVPPGGKGGRVVSEEGERERVS